MHRDRAGRYVLALLIWCAAPAGAKPQAKQTLGRVDFPIACNAGAQRAFTRGISALHSFWYDEARAQLQAAQEADPKCAMAYAGEALAHIEVLWLDDDTEGAQQALAKIPAEPAAPQERAWLGAVRSLTGGGDTWTRRQAFARAMGEMHARWPADLEVTAFDALAQLVELPEPDVTHQARAAALAFEVLAKNPDHPGGLHYAIHATDTPELAPLGLPAARRYAQTAPEAFHARHMPAHIFARLGLWPEALAACQSAWDASTHWVQAAKREGGKRDFHSLSWIVAIDTELGRYQDAERALATFAEGARTASGAHVRGYYAFTARQFLEASGEWKRAPDLLAALGAEGAPAIEAGGKACHAPGGTAGLQNAVGAIEVATIHAHAAAAAHDLAAIKRQLAAIGELRKTAEPRQRDRLGELPYQRYVKKHALMDQALLAQANRDDATLAARYKEIAALEDEEAPLEGADGAGGAHQVRADALMRLGRAKEAAEEYARSLKQHPGHAASELGAARAAVKLGDLAAARAHYARLTELWSHADPGFALLDEAKQFVALHAAAR